MHYLLNAKETKTEEMDPGQLTHGGQAYLIPWPKSQC